MADTASLPIASQARVSTPKARNYLIQLCKHFAHKIPATFADNKGRIEFESGVCELNADDENALVLAVSAGSPDKLATLEDVIDRHLKRFAFKEELSIAWVRG
ncbi:MAG TPA: DUF2218 domain-containing protein [Hyphomonadaceae bacterium]|jgi:hypothetical protein|nr:DUF2218 domain-containing protein [Hyphomonadaceae bacterium]HPN06165.1 DUF2218 domain-containing protein [Hyphomonadaceae bacterium]